MVRSACIVAQIAFALAALVDALALGGIGMTALVSLSFMALGVRLGYERKGVTR